MLLLSLSASAKSVKNPGTQGLSVRFSGPVLFGVCAGAAAVSREMSEINSRRAKGREGGYFICARIQDDLVF